MARKIRIRRVIDGDSLEVKYGGWFGFMRRPFPVRLYGIDAPELSQPYGREAREQLASLVRRGGIRMEARATDRYGRTVGLLYPGRRGREPINVAMVRSGMAYWYRRYGGRDLGLPEAEAEAISKAAWSMAGWPALPSPLGSPGRPAARAGTSAVASPAAHPAGDCGGGVDYIGCCAAGTQLARVIVRIRIHGIPGFS